MSNLTTLGALRDALKALPQDAEVYIDNRRPTSLGSYRGYYDHLAILRDEGVENEFTEKDARPEPFDMSFGYGTYHPGISEVRIKAEPTVADLIAALDLADGAVFEGYKGGQFAMDSGSDVWVSQYGNCDRLRIKEQIEDLPGRVDLATYEESW
jgi:hypothetical protein